LGYGSGEMGKWGDGEKKAVFCLVPPDLKEGVGKETSFICGGENFFIRTDSYLLTPPTNFLPQTLFVLPLSLLPTSHFRY